MCAHRFSLPKSPTPRASARGLRPIFGQRVRDPIGALSDPDIWLRACAIAALRQRDGVATFELGDLPGIIENRGVRRDCLASGSDNGGDGDAPPQPTPRPSARRSCAALAAVSCGALPSEAVPEGSIRPVGARVGRSGPRANSPWRQSHASRRRPAMRSLRSIARRLEERVCLLGAIWVIRIGRVLVRERLLNRRVALIAFRLSSRLSKRAWTIWRSERARRQSAIWNDRE